MIPYGRQDITSEDITAVREVLESDWLTQGPKVPEFEHALTDKFGTQYAVAVNSATSALHIACMALGLGPNDLLWTVPNTFVASANCARYCGAGVDFVDIDERTYNISIDSLKAKLKKAKQECRLPKVLVVVHHSGQPCLMEEVAELAKAYGVRLIEDASHAVGSRYKGEYVGNCRLSDIVIFSFHPVKIITTGEGGVALTDDEQLAKRMELYRSHGITRDANMMEFESHGLWYYEQVDLGFNYRMTELQAALGISQLRRLDEYVARRRELAARYDELLRSLPFRTPWQHPDGESARHLYVIRVDADRTSRRRHEIFQFMRDNGVGVNVHYIPVHLQPYYRRLGFQPGDFPNAEAYYETAISIPLYATMSQADQDRVVNLLADSVAQ